MVAAGVASAAGSAVAAPPLAPTAAAASASANALRDGAPGSDLDLLVRHETRTLGADGVTRTTSFSERIHRRADMVWIERGLPTRLPAASHDHGAHALDAAAHGHSHAGVATAARWIARGADGQVSVRLVDAAMRAVIDVPPAEYANVGFDGSWAGTRHLLDPQMLATMRQVGASAGVRRYEARRGDTRVSIVWDVAGAFPRQVEAVDANGLRRTQVTASAPGRARPWENLAGWRRMDYSDLLD